MGKFSIAFVAYLALNSPYSRMLNQDLDLMRRNYNLWGPSARTCICLTDDYALVRHKWELADAVDRLTRNSAQFESIDAVSVLDELFVVRPTESRQCETVEFASDHVLGLVTRAYATRHHEAREKFYRTNSGHKWFGASVARIFETSVLLWFHHAPVNNFIQCYSDLIFTPDLKILPCRENMRYFSEFDELMDVHRDEKRLCMVLVFQADPTLDAIVITKRSVITVKITLSHKHDANPAVFKNVYDGFSPEFLSQPRERYHVFLTDTVDKAILLRKQKTLRDKVKKEMGINLYSAFIKFEKLDSVMTGERVDELETKK